LLKAVLWDVDGTLVSTKDLYLECYRRALEPYVGKRMTDEEMLALRPHSELHVLRHHSGDAFEECMASFKTHYAELHPTLFGGVYDGVAEVLAELRARGLPNGIVTGKSRSSWEIMLTEIELGHFDVVIADDDVSHPKPSPEGILAALDHLKVHPGDAMYIGDSPVDIEAAQTAGTRAVAAMWSKDETWRERFMLRTRDYPKFEMLDHPSGLLALIGEVNHV
jgi:HAD superfamily hydrolase (TIGR01509 family)